MTEQATFADPKTFGTLIGQLIAGQNLDRDTMRKCFENILENQQPDLHQGAFLAALRAKGETPEEIAGAWEAIDRLATFHTASKLPDKTVENCGTGMDRLKTFNISTAASIVAAAAGIPMARHGARALSSKCGTVDVAEALGIDVECCVDQVATSIIKSGIGLFNGMSGQVHSGALGRILATIRFGTTLNIAASLANPAKPKYAVRGVHDPSSLQPVAKVMHAMGYKRVLLVHGYDNHHEPAMDELSILGKSDLMWLEENGTLREETITPEDLGLKRGEASQILSSGNAEQEASRMQSIISGNGNETETNCVALNAAAVLVIADKAASLKEGIDMSLTLMRNGNASDTLNRWIECQQTPSQDASEIAQ